MNNPVQKILVLGMILLISFPLLHRIGFISYFHFYNDYIRSTLCVNKEKPELKCDGKCHLKDYVQLQQQEEEQSPEPLRLDVFKNLQLIYIPFSIANLPTKNITIKLFSVSVNKCRGKLFIVHAVDYISQQLRPPIA